MRFFELNDIRGNDRQDIQNSVNHGNPVKKVRTEGALSSISKKYIFDLLVRNYVGVEFLGVSIQ
jgi:hypothetical protein